MGSPIMDTDMVLDTTDTEKWASLDTPDLLPLLLPGAPKVFVAKGPLTPNLITEVMEVTDTVCPQDMPTFLVFTTMARGPLKPNLIMEVTEVTVMVMVMVTVMAVVMVIMVKHFLAVPNHGMGIIYLIIHAYFLTLLKKTRSFKNLAYSCCSKKNHNNATLFTNLE